ncbi:Lys-63-Specific Deubiquitinase Brcc36 [Manis pentadactyla]|nr:Lys-63-Specific Deubiquitinase Brcc36 [Manis pentadactyla]
MAVQVVQAVQAVHLDSDAFLVCLNHALSTEKEEVMGLCIGELNDDTRLTLSELFTFILSSSCDALIRGRIEWKFLQSSCLRPQQRRRYPYWLIRSFYGLWDLAARFPCLLP